MDSKILESVGLTKSEIKLYITLLKIGNTTSGDLIKKSEVSRSKVYDVLEKLKKKGFVSEIIKENIRHFEATDPSKITDYLILRKNEIDDLVKKSKILVNDLKKIQNSHLEKQEARVYTGIEGLKTIYNEILQEMSARDEYLAFGIGKKEISDEKISLIIRKFHIKRAEKNIPARIIMHSSTRDLMKKFSNIGNYTYRFTKENLPTNIAIFKNNILILVWGEGPIAFLIKSKEVAYKYKRHFEEVWKSSK